MFVVSKVFEFGTMFSDIFVGQQFKHLSHRWFCPVSNPFFSSNCLNSTINLYNSGFSATTLLTFSNAWACSSAVGPLSKPQARGSGKSTIWEYPRGSGNNSKHISVLVRKGEWRNFSEFSCNISQNSNNA